MENPTPEAKMSTALVTTPQSTNQKGIKNHLKVAKHLKKAAQGHTDAAKHHEAGDHEKAAQSTMNAHGHLNIACKAQQKDVEQHALKG